MAKKKKLIELSNQNLNYKEKNNEFKLLRFMPQTMTVDVSVHEDGIYMGTKNIAYAHLPKSIKKMIKPN
ncbi:hypothetical protein [Sulfurimonas sp.]|uniref:hypothetical protein n=1 Tax=Sulfurimonas sp. TaxID=2022749 RepID=UPI002606389E|nr:hypothetical protein [Sulfurimonas sp.]